MDNYKKSGRRGIRIPAQICDRVSVSEMSFDFSLPDYQPEIKRLLRVRATVSPPDKYVGAGNADFSGTVDFSILYSGNDGALYCANESAEYKFSSPVEVGADFEINDGILCDTDVYPDMTVGRVAAPRKLSVKCRLRARVRMWGTRVIEEPFAGETDGTLQRLTGQAECVHCFAEIGEPLVLGDEILTDSDAADLRVISAEAQVFVTEAVASSEAVNCRGEVCLKLLCCHENTKEPPMTIHRRIPFTQSVSCDGVEVNCDACADGIPTELHVTVEEGRVLCETTVRLRVRAQRNETVSFTRDLYSTAADCETGTADYTIPSAIRSLNGNFSLGSTLSLEEAGIRAGMTPIDVSLTPHVTGFECDHGKGYLIGSCRAHLILFDGEDASAQELELPFRYECDCGGEEIRDYDATVTPLTCRARMDGERIAIDAELGVSLALRQARQIRILTSAHLGENVVRAGAIRTVCYPSREDTLWSVAKRYHRSVDAIANLNSLGGSHSADAPESLSGIKYLLV